MGRIAFVAGLGALSLVAAIAWLVPGAGPEDQLRANPPAPLRVLGATIANPFASTNAANADDQREQRNIRHAVPIEARFVGNIGSAELTQQFDQLVSAARQGDGDMAHALSERLRVCGSAPPRDDGKLRITREHRSSSANAAGLCAGMTSAHTAHMKELAAIALAANIPQAVLNHALDEFEAIDTAAKQYATQNPGAAPRTDLAPRAAAQLERLVALAEDGSLPALQALTELHRSSELAATDDAKYYAYRVVLEADWNKPAADIERSPVLDQVDPARKQEVVELAQQMFTRCCWNRKKF